MRSCDGQTKTEFLPVSAGFRPTGRDHREHTGAIDGNPAGASSDDPMAFVIPDDPTVDARRCDGGVECNWPFCAADYNRASGLGAIHLRPFTDREISE